jgi:hypothetical protein
MLQLISNIRRRVEFNDLRFTLNLCYERRQILSHLLRVEECNLPCFDFQLRCTAFCKEGIICGIQIDRHGVHLDSLVVILCSKGSISGANTERAAFFLKT